jgi:hypothetical protein
MADGFLWHSFFSTHLFLPCLASSSSNRQTCKECRK